MDPELVRVAADVDPTFRHCPLLAWKAMDGKRQLVGFCSFAVSRPRQSDSMSARSWWIEIRIGAFDAVATTARRSDVDASSSSECVSKKTFVACPMSSAQSTDGRTEYRGELSTER
jgi:hypothetical protein